MASNNSFQARQLQSLINLLGKQSDDHVTLIVGKKRAVFDIHRVLLASISPVFKAMLYGPMQESKMNAEITITDIDAIAFQCVLSHAHCTDPLLTPQNIIAVRQIADKYQISLLSELCDTLFPSFLTPNNICSLLSDAVTMKLEPYLIQCQHALSTKATQIIQSSAFLSMSIEAMRIVLQSDDLSVKEEDIWDAVVNWIDYQISMKYTESGGDCPPTNDVSELSEARAQLLKQVYPFIRFGLMDATYFIKKVKSQNCLTSEEIAEVLCYMQCKDEKCTTFSTKPRAEITPLSLQTQILQIVKMPEVEMSDEGCSIEELLEKLSNKDVYAIRGAIHDLACAGLVYSTVDEDHYKYSGEYYITEPQYTSI